MRHRIGSDILFTNPFLDFRRQVRRSAARQRTRQVIARQRRQRTRHRLRRLLQIAAGAVLPHRVVVCPLHHRRIGRRFTALLKLLPGLRQRHRVFLRLQPGDISLRADDVHRLAANLPNQLRLLEPVLLLLLVEYRADAAVVGMLGIPVQLRHILLLFVFVANYQRTFADPGLRRALGMPAVVGARQHAAGHVGQQVFAHRPAGAEAAAAMRCAVVRLVVDVRPAQRAGIEAVLLFVRLACNNGAVELGVFFDLDVIPALAGKQPGLLFYRVEVAVQLVLAGAYVG